MFSPSNTCSKLMFMKKNYIFPFSVEEHNIQEPTMDINAHIKFTHTINWLNVFPIVHDICKLEI